MKCCRDYESCENGCPLFDKYLDVNKKGSLSYFKFKVCMGLKMDDPFDKIMDLVELHESGKAIYYDSDTIVETDSGYFLNLMERIKRLDE